MLEEYSASIVNTVVYCLLAAACYGIYRFRIPNKAFLWVAASLICADDNIAYHWLLEKGSLLTEVTAAVMGMASALFAVKATMVMFRVERLVPHSAFLTLPLSMTAVMLFHEPALYAYQLAIGQFALAIPYMEASHAAWHARRKDNLGKVMASILGALAVVFLLRLGYALLMAGSGLSESQFLNSSVMQISLFVNILLVVAVLISVFAIIIGDFVAHKRRMNRQQATAASQPLAI